MKLYRINGKAVYVDKVEDLREIVSDEIYSVIEDLFFQKESEVENSNEDFDEVNAKLDDCEDALKEIVDECDGYMKAVADAKSLNKKGQITRFDNIRAIAWEVLP